MKNPVYAISGVTGQEYFCEDHKTAMDSFHRGAKVRLITDDDSRQSDKPTCGPCLHAEGRSWGKSWQNY